MSKSLRRFTHPSGSLRYAQSRAAALLRNAWSNQGFSSSLLAPRVYKKAPRCGAVLYMAEREGFEPSMSFNTHTPLAGARLQPLGHLSKDLLLSTDNWRCFKARMRPAT